MTLDVERMCFQPTFIKRLQRANHQDTQETLLGRLTNQFLVYLQELFIHLGDGVNSYTRHLIIC